MQCHVAVAPHTPPQTMKRIATQNENPARPTATRKDAQGRRRRLAALVRWAGRRTQSHTCQLTFCHHPCYMHRRSNRTVYRSKPPLPPRLAVVRQLPRSWAASDATGWPGSGLGAGLRTPPSPLNAGAWAWAWERMATAISAPARRPLRQRGISAGRRRPSSSSSSRAVHWRPA